MGDMSHEPSMEDILSSIKKIIAEDGGKGSAAKARRLKPGAEAETESETQAQADVLELTDAVDEHDVLSDGLGHSTVEPVGFMPQTELERVSAVAAHDDHKSLGAEPLTDAAPAPSESMISAQSAAASKAALAKLSEAKAVETASAAGGNGSLTDFVGDLLRPMLKDWLDSNLPAIVERMVAKEIARLRD